MEPAAEPLETLVCTLSCVPMRLEPDLICEMTSQVLFGERCRVLESRHQFRRVRLEYDGYEGWVDRRHFMVDDAPRHDFVLSGDICAEAASARRTLHLPLGATLPGYKDGEFSLGSEKFKFKGSVIPLPETVKAEAMMRHAMRYLDAPYHWGGRTPFGIDCSGFAQMTFHAFGIRLLRDSRDQITQGSLVPDVTQARPMDLAFFVSAKDGEGHHVGLVFPNGKILHASGLVKLDNLDEEGIKLPATGEWTHRLKEIRRVLPESAQ